jgi:tRNA (guanine37-N1)-methyltransferase
MLFLKVPRKEGEKVRRRLLEAGVLDRRYDIVRSGDLILFPVSGSWGAFETVELHAVPRPERHGRLEDALEGFLTPSELEGLVTSFDIVGDIAIVEIPPGLEPKEGRIGLALLSVHRNLRTVLKKLGPMEGEYRVRRLKCIAGEDRTETYCKESGVTMRLDLSKVYFSVRLATERTRIAGMVGDGERVLVLFAGVGPFGLVIARQKPGARVVAVELNPDAVAFMKENISINRLGNMEAILADARKLDLAAIGGAGSFDRVVMPLPKSAHEFLDVAFAAVKDGGMVHFYTIVGTARPLEEAMEKAKAEARNCGISLGLASSRIVRPYSPSQEQVVLDLLVSRKGTG